MLASVVGASRLGGGGSEDAPPPPLPAKACAGCAPGSEGGRAALAWLVALKAARSWSKGSERPGTCAGGLGLGLR